MSKFSGLRANKETIEVETADGKLEIDIHPLKNKELMDAGEDFQKNVMSSKGTTRLIMLTLKKDDPDVTEEDVAELPLPMIAEIMKAIMRVNKLDKFIDVDKKKLDSDPTSLRIQQIESLRESSRKEQKDMNQQDSKTQ